MLVEKKAFLVTVHYWARSLELAACSGLVFLSAGLFGCGHHDSTRGDTVISASAGSTVVGVSSASEVTSTQPAGTTAVCRSGLQDERIALKDGVSLRFPMGVLPDEKSREGAPPPEPDTVSWAATLEPLLQDIEILTCNGEHPKAKISWGFAKRVGVEVDSPVAPLEKMMADCFSGNLGLYPPGPYSSSAAQKNYWRLVTHQVSADNTNCTAEIRWQPQADQIGVTWFANSDIKPDDLPWFREAVIFRGKMGIDGLLHGYTLRYIVPESDWPHVSETIWSSLKSMEIDWEKFGMPTQPPNRKELRLRKGR